MRICLFRLGCAVYASACEIGASAGGYTHKHLIKNLCICGHFVGFLLFSYYSVSSPIAAEHDDFYSKELFYAVTSSERTSG